MRVVDDLLRFDRTFPEYVAGVCDVLQEERDAGITFSKEKFRFARDHLSWVGYEIKKRGVGSFGPSAINNQRKTVLFSTVL